jgi:hypothetical protein
MLDKWWYSFWRQIMARMECKCGEVLSNSMAPNGIQLRVYTDKEWDSILSDDTIEAWKIPLPQYDVWKCLKCERVYVFKEGMDSAIKIYTLESALNPSGFIPRPLGRTEMRA